MKGISSGKDIVLPKGIKGKPIIIYHDDDNDPSRNIFDDNATTTTTIDSNSTFLDCIGLLPSIEIESIVPASPTSPPPAATTATNASTTTAEQQGQKSTSISQRRKHQRRRRRPLPPRERMSELKRKFEVQQYLLPRQQERITIFLKQKKTIRKEGNMQASMMAKVDIALRLLPNDPIPVSTIIPVLLEQYYASNCRAEFRIVGGDAGGSAAHDITTHNNNGDPSKGVMISISILLQDGTIIDGTQTPNDYDLHHFDSIFFQVIDKRKNNKQMNIQSNDSCKIGGESGNHLGIAGSSNFSIIKNDDGGVMDDEEVDDDGDDEEGGDKVITIYIKTKYIQFDETYTFKVNRETTQISDVLDALHKRLHILQRPPSMAQQERHGGGPHGLVLRHKKFAITRSTSKRKKEDGKSTMTFKDIGLLQDNDQLECYPHFETIKSSELVYIFPNNDKVRIGI